MKKSSRGVKGEKSHGMGHYPKGAINQHKAMATGDTMRSPNKRNMGGDMNMSGRVGNDGFSSSGTTGGPMNKAVPRSTTVPDKKGPKGHKVPNSTMTKW